VNGKLPSCNTDCDEYDPHARCDAHQGLLLEEFVFANRILDKSISEHGIDDRDEHAKEVLPEGQVPRRPVGTSAWWRALALSRLRREQPGRVRRLGPSLPTEPIELRQHAGVPSFAHLMKCSFCCSPTMVSADHAGDDRISTLTQLLL
jgi:hypothetical protein